MLPDNANEAIQTLIDQTQDQRLNIRWAYYTGDHPKIWVTPKLRETFRALADSLTENYCGLAVNARLSRLEVTGFNGDSAPRAEEVWKAGRFPQRQDVWYRWGLVHGATYLVVQDDLIEANSAGICYAQPDPDDWMNVAWAGKVFVDGGVWRCVLWDEQNLYRYNGPTAEIKDNRTVIPKGEDFQPASEGDVESHGYQRVPVFPANPYGFMAPNMIDQISSVQDRINKLSANKFVAAEFGAFKQRVFFTQQQVDPYALRQQPDTAIVLDPGEDGKARVQELGATDLRNYDEAKNAEVDALFTIASLPRHMRVNPGATPSGEAIKADEGPFVESLRDHQREFGETLMSAYALIGVENVEPVWRDVEPHDDLINAQVVSTLVGAGIPWQVAAQKYLGMSEEDVREAQALIQSQTPSGVDDFTTSFLRNPLLQGE